MATLQKIGDKQVYPINLSQVGIGRAPDNEIVVDDEAVSLYHAMVITQASQTVKGGLEYIIEDLDSTNGVQVNNMKIQSRQLTNGDIVRVGNTRLKFSSKDVVPPQEDFKKTKKLDKLGFPKF